MSGTMKRTIITAVNGNDLAALFRRLDVLKYFVQHMHVAWNEETCALAAAG
jgi:hypothetical protein